MGGYGGASGRVKGKCYYDTGGHKVKDKNAIEVAECYIRQGKYVAFLQEKDGQGRADLSVEGHYVEVKGISTLNSNTVSEQLKHAFEQIHGDDFRYPANTHREGKVILLSRHSQSIPTSEIMYAIQEGFLMAERKNFIKGKLEVWINGQIYKLN